LRAFFMSRMSLCEPASSQGSRAFLLRI
jgi:hypothetical protein